MKHCDLVTGIGRIQRAAAELKEKWLDTHSHWDDKARRDFEKNHLQPLPSQITMVVAAVHELAELMEQAESELEDPQTYESM
jgi:hypothetical protein